MTICFFCSGCGQQHPDGQAPDDDRSTIVLQEKGLHGRGDDPGITTQPYYNSSVILSHVANLCCCVYRGFKELTCPILSPNITGGLICFCV